MRKDSVVANIAKDLGLDIEQLIFRRFHIVSHNSDSYFFVNLEDGNIYIKNRIDRESLCARAATCFLSIDAVVENPLNVFKVKIEIQDINDNPPSFFQKTIKLEIIESTLPGARFVLQNAEDPDIGINSLQSYKLSDNHHFTLSEKTSTDGSKFPELVLEKPLDRETQNTHEVILTAVDGGNPIRSGMTLIKIIITDVNDNTPIFKQEVYKVSLYETTPINSSVLFVSASDEDEGSHAQITYSFSTSGNILDMFNIDPENGEIKTKTNLDFEKTQHYEMSIQAQDGGGFVSHCKVLVEIIDENDNAPLILIRSSSSPVPEDTTPGTVIALIEVHDKDFGRNGEVDCQIMETVPLELVLSSSRYYRIITNNFLDREKLSYYNITILATDRGYPQLSSTATIRLDILDINDNPPLFQKPIYFAYVLENNLPGASIYSIHASDLDTGDNAKVIYSISSIKTEDSPVSSYFSINVETGIFYAQRSFDYEQHKEFVVHVTANDSGSPSLSSNATIILHIMDQNDNAPKILYPSPESGGSPSFEIVSFTTEEGSLITKVVAVDVDSGHNAWLSYHLLQTSELFYFSINQHTGEIRTTRPFQLKDLLNHKLVVLVKDNGVPTLSATATLSLVVGDNFQQLLPKLNYQIPVDNVSSNLQMYLVIALGLISMFFILTVILVLISKCKEAKSSTSFGSFSTNLYSQVDPRILSQFNDGTLSLPYTYNVCVALDSTENNCTFRKPHHNVPIDNLIDSDVLAPGNENLKESMMPTSDTVPQAQPNTDWRFSQAQRPGPSGAQPTEEAGVWPNNQFETERLQAMILASANEAAEGASAMGGGNGTMGLSARYGPQFTLQHVPDYRQNIYIPGTTSTLTNAAGKRDGKSAAPSGGNKKKSGKKEKK
ncbi:protocadherin gamma-B1-like isoform X37 [Pelobates fuscus]|uniref:protocadherin gamma-B1-like isoform X37 n=1 Tax=Pelobates fuscus TaxID=191477 RepID=UPI002FE46336